MRPYRSTIFSTVWYHRIEPDLVFYSHGHVRVRSNFLVNFLASLLESRAAAAVIATTVHVM